MAPTPRRVLSLALILTTVATIAVAGHGSLSSAENRAERQTRPSDDAEVFKKTLVPALLGQLLRLSRHDSQLQRLVARIRISIPANFNATWSPNAYAVPDPAGDFIVVDARYLDRVMTAAILGGMVVSPSRDVADVISRIRRDYPARRTARGGRADLKAEAMSIDRYLVGVSALDVAVLQELRSSIFWDSFIWIMLHEAAHHALGHRHPPVGVTESRERELAADAWASGMMQRLGYGVFWVAQFLKGQALLDEWLGLGTEIEEAKSTHPTWGTRLKALNQKFDVTRTPQSDFFFSYSPLPPDKSTGTLTYFTAPRPSASSSSGNRARGTSIEYGGVEWSGTTMRLYTRQDKTREELTFRDTDRFLGRLTVNVMDEAGLVIAEMSTLTIQQAPASREGMPIVGDVTMKEMLDRIKSKDPLRRAVSAVSDSPEVLDRIMKANHLWTDAQEATKLAWFKGQLSTEQADLRLFAAGLGYEQRLNEVLSRQRIEQVFALMEKDPLMKLGVLAKDEIVHYARRMVDAWFKP